MSALIEVKGSVVRGDDEKMTSPSMRDSIHFAHVNLYDGQTRHLPDRLDAPSLLDICLVLVVVCIESERGRIVGDIVGVAKDD